MSEITEQLFDGSPSLALDTDPGFQKFYFCERLKRNVEQLERLSKRPENSDKFIKIVRDDANNAIGRELADIDWQKHRGVLFLDPYGAQVEWATLERIASTRLQTHKNPGVSVFDVIQAS